LALQQVPAQAPQEPMEPMEKHHSTNPEWRLAEHIPGQLEVEPVPEALPAARKA
jgi:hypothetical protein